MEIELPKYDPWSFNREERRVIQERFGQNFRVLIDYVRERVISPTPPSIPDLKYPDGSVIFADEVFEAFWLQLVRREDPDAPDDLLADASLGDFLFRPAKDDEDAAEDGEDGGEGKATSSPQKRSKAQKKP